MSDSRRLFGSPTKDWWDDETTDRDPAPIDAARLQGMSCVRLDDGAWWDED